MNKPIWKESTKTFHGLPCIQLTVCDPRTGETETQYQMSGAKGDIWVNNEGLVTYKYFTLLPGGDEKLSTCNYSELKRVKDRLKVPFSSAEQAKIANSR